MNVSMRSAIGRIGSVVTLIACLVACGASTASQAVAEPTAAMPPVMPADWVVISSDDGQVRLAVPPDMANSVFTHGSVMAQAPLVDGAIGLEAWAVTVDATTRFEPGEPIVEWLVRAGWWPRAEEGLATGPISQEQLVLPAGEAVRLAMVVGPDTPHEAGVVAYVIATDRGRAVLRFVGNPALLEARSAEVDLMSRLVAFGAQP